ncbi:hypothetical protein HZC08_02125, partial [Candidatus Micrarchaeota archaeon]|nr:hypothetical protein [Candidatus Micrarchaeota archaeon]
MSSLARTALIKPTSRFNILKDRLGLVEQIIKTNKIGRHPVLTLARMRGVELEDVLSAGNLGLVEAAQKYDPSKGSLSAIAGPYIMKEVRDLLNSAGRRLYVPKNATYFLNLKRKALEFLEQNPSPGSEDLAKLESEKSKVFALVTELLADPAKLPLLKEEVRKQEERIFNASDGPYLEDSPEWDAGREDSLN